MDDNDYRATQREIDRLLDKGKLTTAEESYLDLLGTLVMDYESTAEAEGAYELRGVELIRGLRELRQLKQKDLTPIFKTPSIVSAVLHGKRPLTAELIPANSWVILLANRGFMDIKLMKIARQLN